ncbi:nitroreductase family protein, partial [Herbaspirillum sp. HC18]
MAARLDDAALAQLLAEARTHRAWQPKDVPDALIQELTRLMLW